MDTKIAFNQKNSFLLSFFFNKYLLLIFFLLGGISIQPGSIQLGSTSCEAAGIYKAPAKEKVERRANRLYQRLLHKFKSKDGHGLEALGILATLIIIALGGLAVLFALQAFGVIAIMGLAGGFLAAFASLIFLGLMIYALFLFYWN